MISYEEFEELLYKIREAGITVPVLPGIMPITNANQVERAIKLSGSFMPQRFLCICNISAETRSVNGMCETRVSHFLILCYIRSFLAIFTMSVSGP